VAGLTGLSLNPAARAALESQGWSGGRRTDVSAAIARLTDAGYAVDARMADVLASFAGIKVGPVVVRGVDFHNDEPLIVDPVGVGARNREECADLESRFGTRFCPLGWWLSRSHVYFGSSGLVVAALPGVVWHVGDTLGDAINFMLLADRPLVRLRSADGMDDPGVPPGDE
jgi:hypothetical protein